MSFYAARIELQLGAFHLHLSFESEARVIGLFGPSGCGKSSALRCVAGLLQASGYLRCGEDVWIDSSQGIDLDPAKRAVGYVPQNHCLFPHWNVRQNILAARLGAASDSEQRRRRFEEVIALLEIDALLGRRVDQLSGGQCQRVALGRALCAMPKLLLLDEPMASLDGDLRRRILPYLVRIRDELDLPILIVSHNPLELQLLCEEVIAMREGACVGQGTPREVFTNAKVYPGIASAFENILELEVMEQTAQKTLTRIIGATGQNGVIVLPSIPGKQTGTVRVGLAPHDLLIGMEKPRRISARNVLAGSVVQIKSLGDNSLITVAVAACGATELVAEVTADAAAELGLRVGAPVFLFFKTNAAQLYL
ncbi:MAG: molybdenum ABC transporter ATP-binding protein [Opitutales bacterium]